MSIVIEYQLPHHKLQVVLQRAAAPGACVSMPVYPKGQASQSHYQDENSRCKAKPLKGYNVDFKPNPSMPDRASLLPHLDSIATRSTMSARLLRPPHTGISSVHITQLVVAEFLESSSCRWLIVLIDA